MTLSESKSVSELDTESMPVMIAPSILSADFARLGEQIRAVEDAGAHQLHVDVMDGHFVPEITIGLPVLKSIQKVTSLPLDVHLMVRDPDRFVDQFAPAGAASVTVHVEAAPHLDRTLRNIRSHGVAAGVALNPATPIAAIEHVLELVDIVLIMSVNPGYGGQKFIPYSIGKIAALGERIRARGLSVDISVDGGVNIETLAGVVGAGANVFVAGAAVFSSEDPGARVKEMLEMAGSLGYDS
jgi:ribulose-phosphate 3-epimerase